MQRTRGCLLPHHVRQGGPPALYHHNMSRLHSWPGSGAQRTNSSVVAPPHAAPPHAAPPHAAPPHAAPPHAVPPHAAPPHAAPPHAAPPHAVPPHAAPPHAAPPHAVPPHAANRKRRRDQPFQQPGKRQRLGSAPLPYATPTPKGPGIPPCPFPRSPSAAPPGTSSPLQLRPVLAPPPERHDPLLGPSPDQLSRQMVALFEACRQQPSDLEWKEICRVGIQQDIRRSFPQARLYLTGSSMSGLGCRSSDADLCLVVGGNKNVLRVLHQLYTLFQRLTYVTKVTLIRAKVPILRFRERRSNVEFDLNINNTVGIRNTFLLKSYGFADVRVRPLVLVVKKWARHMEINDASAGTLSSYALVLMTLHYLQTLQEPVLPSLQKDFPMSFDPSREIDQVPEWSQWVPPYVSKNQWSLGELLLGFLRYYATEFRWDRQVISVRQAKAFPKNASMMWNNKFICVEEPFEGNNVARAVHKQLQFDLIKAQFNRSYRSLDGSRNLNSILPVDATMNQELSLR